MLSPRLISFACVATLLVACSESSDSDSKDGVQPHVFIDGVFTTAPASAQSVARPPERAALASIELPCDGGLGVRLGYTDWDTKAPGLCGAVTNCGHAQLTFTLGTQSKSTTLVATPGLLQLGNPAAWSGTGTLQVQLLKDDGTPYLTKAVASGDQIEVPLVPASCSDTPSGEGGAPSGEGGAPSGEGGAPNSGEGGVGGNN